MSAIRGFPGKVAYLLSGAMGRLHTPRTCPSCGSAESTTVDRKFFHQLQECLRCRLLFRFPVEKARMMAEFYDAEYAEPGLTTELPDQATLAGLIGTEFRGSSKDFSKAIDILKSLGLRPGMRILEFGANWGYATWQMSRAGYQMTAFEISRPRARFGTALGVEILTTLDEVGSDFDAVFSWHVLEHVPDPALALRQQLGLLKPGGLLIGNTPNGSAAYRNREASTFHATWGHVHPCLLTDRFVATVADGRPFLVTSDDSPRAVATWDRESQEVRDVSGAGLFFVMRQRDHGLGESQSGRRTREG